MSDRIKFAVSAIPIEMLTTENSTEKDVIASEVNTNLGGGGESVNLTDYSGSALVQGYSNGIVNYLGATYNAGGTQLGGVRDFFFIKNTGYKYSSATELGDITTDCVMVVLKETAYVNLVDGGYTDAAGVTQDHYYEVAWLKPGQAIVLPGGSTNLSITQFGSNANDLSALGQTSSNGQAKVMVRTYKSDGTAATSSNAVEFLCVT